MVPSEFAGGRGAWCSCFAWHDALRRELKEKMEAAANEKARAKAKEDAESMARKALEALLQEQNKTDEQRK